MLDRLKLGLARFTVPLMIRWKWRGKLATALAVSDETFPVVGGRIGVRIYTPQGQGPFPVLLFLHGGGWVFGNLETHDALCRDLCVQGGHMVLAVDYRLAPEHPFPVPVNDCLAALDWARDNLGRLGGDASRLVLVGDSAGGNLAAVVVQQARRQQPGLVKGQVLIYPVMDHCAHTKRRSYELYGQGGYVLDHKGMTQFWDWYLRGSSDWFPESRTHELATPLHALDLKGIPRSLVLLAEQDMLCDEGAEYAQKLSEAGTEVEIVRYPGQQHAFVGPEPSAAHRQAVADIARWLQAPDQEGRGEMQVCREAE